MSNFPVRACHAHQLDRSKHLLIKLDGRGCAVDDQVRRECLVTVGNRLYGARHHLSLFLLGNLARTRAAHRAIVNLWRTRFNHFPMITARYSPLTVSAGRSVVLRPTPLIARAFPP